MEARTLTIGEDTEGADPFEVTVIAPDAPSCLVLFAAGRGGNPARYRGLLETLAERGCLVVAPQFDMMASTLPNRGDLEERLVRLAEAVMHFNAASLPLVGLGHSIGTALLLVLAGARAHTSSGEHVEFARPLPFARLALMTPPAGFFRAPGALDAVRVPVAIWAGEKDSVTPPEQALFLKGAFRHEPSAVLVIDPDAGHFTFMDELPPNVEEPHPQRERFLERLALEMGDFFGL